MMTHWMLYFNYIKLENYFGEKQTSLKYWKCFDIQEHGISLPLFILPQGPLGVSCSSFKNIFVQFTSSA